MSDNNSSSSSSSSSSSDSIGSTITVISNTSNTSNTTLTSSTSNTTNNNMIIKEVTNFLLDLLSGGTAGILSKTIIAPLERVKLILQTQHVNNDIPKGHILYNGPYDCIKRVYNEQGILSFWRGNVANVLRYFPSQAMNFAFKDKYKALFVGNASKDDGMYRMFIGNLAAGGAAGGTALFVSYPLDVARTRLAADVAIDRNHMRYRGTFDCIYNIYKSRGITGLYSGFLVSLTGVVLFKAMFMGGYDIGKSFVLGDNGTSNDHKSKSNSGSSSSGSNSSTLFYRMIIAQTVTTVAGTLCYPLDTIRRRIMMQSKMNNNSQQLRYSSGIHCFKMIMKEEGVKGLFRGLSVNLFRGISGSILLVGYDEFNSFFKSIT